MLTASSLPPSPTSSTAASSFDCENSRSIASVVNSKYVSVVSARALLDGFELGYQRVIVGIDPIDPGALVESQQVRRRVQPDTITGGAQHRVEHRAR